MSDFGKSLYKHMKNLGANPKSSLLTASEMHIIESFQQYFDSNFFKFDIVECNIKDLNSSEDEFIGKSINGNYGLFKILNGLVLSENGHEIRQELTDYSDKVIHKIVKDISCHDEISFLKSISGITPKVGFLGIPLVIFGMLSPLYSNVFNSRLVYTDTNTTFWVVTLFFIFFVCCEYIFKKIIKKKTSDVTQLNVDIISRYLYELLKHSNTHNIPSKIRSIEQAAIFKWENKPQIYIDFSFLIMYLFCLVVILGYYSFGLMLYYAFISYLMYFVRFSSYKDLLSSLKVSGDKFTFLTSFENKKRELNYIDKKHSSYIFYKYYSVDSINRNELDSQNFKWAELTRINVFLSMIIMYFCCFLAIKAEMLQISTVIAIMIINSRLSSSLSSVISRIYQLKVQEHHLLESTTALYKEFFSPQGISLNRVHTIEIKNLEHEIFKRNGVSPISYTFESGKTYAVTGANGIGKTSFLKMISGEIRDYQGKVLVDGHQMKNVSIDTVEKNYSIHFSNMNLLKTSLKDNFKFYGISNIDDVISLLQFSAPRFDLDYEKFELIDAEQLNFSNGEKQKLLLGMTLFKKPSVIILDESTSYLSKMDSIKTIRWIRENNKDAIVIIATHDINIVNMSDYCINISSDMVSGKVVVNM